MESTPRPPAYGFSLVEILVTQAIITVLGLLSFTALNRMRGAGDKAKVLAVLRQLQIANTSFANGNRGRYVPISSWDENNKRANDWHQNTSFIPYLSGDFTNFEKNTPSKTIPVSVPDPVVVRFKERLWDFLLLSYGHNEEGIPGGSTPNSQKGFRTSQFSTPSLTAAFITTTDWIAKYNGRFIWKNSPRGGKSTDRKTACRHGGKAVVVNYDGSNGLISPQDIHGFNAAGSGEPSILESRLLIIRCHLYCLL